MPSGIRILISNDDGINSPGIAALEKSLSNLGEVILVAPDRDNSASSHALSLSRPLRVEKIASGRYSVDGTPTDCINLAVNGLIEGKRPDLIVSGINKGANMGDDITYSGTVSAAMEGVLLRIPSIAVSVPGKDSFIFEPAADYAKTVAEFVLKNGLPKNTLLNVNVPNMPEDKIKGVKFTKQGKRHYNEKITKNKDPRGRTYYWIGGDELAYHKIPNTDIVSVVNGWISVTPIKLDFTDYSYLDTLNDHHKMDLKK
ncbi:MAG: 5'/3'-nucleotidase SurE [Candidatus Mycalebacterium zealandia]|nr:MAG: 5'/3'-nucleotidase SurE [Candidatus Mycalebacterium zealandia]